MTDDAIVEAIITIGNSPKVMKMCEPQICFPVKLEGWMVMRVLKAEELLYNEIQRSKQGDNRLNEQG